MNPTSFDALIWQDGHLVGLNTRLDKRSVATVQILAMIYPAADASQRRLVEITCQDVSRVSSTLDVIELKRHHWAGHIAHGHLKDDALWLYVTDGLVEVRAQAFAIAWPVQP